MKTQKQRYLLCSLMCICLSVSFLAALIIAYWILEKKPELASNKIFSILILCCFSDAEKAELILNSIPYMMFSFLFSSGCLQNNVFLTA